MKTLILVAALAVTGCATGYKSSGAMGGFSERALAPDTYYVKFKGNGWTDEQRATDFMMLRAAELAIENGYGHFAILSVGDETERSVYTTPVTAHTNTTATANVYGNTARVQGRSTTTYSGGQRYPIVKPGVGATIQFLRDASAQAFDAQRVKSSIRAKYKLDE